MSWLFKTLSSSDDPGASTSAPAPESAESPPAGVKEDLSALGQTIGRQLRGVAAFLAPPPTTAANLSGDEPPEKSEALLGIQSDLAEIGGSLKSGLSTLSNSGNRAVGEISKFASSLNPFQKKLDDDSEEDDDEDDGGGYGYGDGDYLPGITDEVLQFVTEISKLSECWTDFPLQFDHGFSMTDAQREHASAIEQYIPDFAVLRKRLCSSMNEEVFWMIYFILLVPRLSGHDSELLSTPGIVKARDELLQNIRNREAEFKTAENSTSLNPSPGQTQVGQTQEPENPSLDQGFSKLEVSDKANTDQSSSKPNDDSGNSSGTDVRFETEDDISFSDLEDEDSDVSRRLSANKKSPTESNDWVQLSGSPEGQSGQRKKDSEGEDSSDWHNVDDFD